jgi:hypothetical protein
MRGRSGPRRTFRCRRGPPPRATSIGTRTALELTDRLMAISARYARELNFVDEVFGHDAREFEAGVVCRAEALAHNLDFTAMLAAKWERRRADERRKPLAAYRAEELARMSENSSAPIPLITKRGSHSC